MGHSGATIPFLFLYADRHGGGDHYQCLCCWKIVACSERDMEYATIIVRFVYFITGTVDKESWEGCHGRGIFLLIIFLMRRASRACVSL